jgi:hypothetical protein
MSSDGTSMTSSAAADRAGVGLVGAGWAGTGLTAGLRIEGSKTGFLSPVGCNIGVCDGRTQSLTCYIQR